MSELTLVEELSLDPSRAALVIQDMQNDVIIEGGAFAESGAPAQFLQYLPRPRQIARTRNFHTGIAEGRVAAAE